MTHICVDKQTIIGSGNGLSPEQHQAIIWTNAGLLLIGPLGTHFNEILIKIQTFSLKKIRLKMSSAKCCSFRRGLNVLKGVDKNTNFNCRYIRYISSIALFIYRGHFSLKNSRKTLHSSRYCRGVVRGCKIWPKYYHCNCCFVCIIVLYVASIYRESIV